MSAILSPLIFLIQIAIVFSAMPPLKKCKISDSACLVATAQSATPALAEGLPEMGMEPLDVMHVDLIKVDLAGLKMTLRDSSITGLKNTVIDKISLNMDKKLMKLAYHVDITMKSLYKASGKLLILPISGDGNSTVDLKRLEVEMTMPFDILKNDNGDDVIELKSMTYKHDIKDNVSIQLTNLFNGNKALSDTMIKFMNENWKILSQEFGGAMLEKPNQKIFKAIKIFLRSQPLKELVEY